jgi:hypothetical protein
MIALSNADFLTLWETGQHLHPLDRGLLAIRASLPEPAPGDPVADWPLGRRNRGLAQVRTLYFGPRLEGWTVCEGCGEQLEFELDCNILADTPEPSAARQVCAHGSTFRLPTSRDLASIANEQDLAQATLRLLQHCKIESCTPDQTDTVSSDRVQPEIIADQSTWPPEAIDEIAEKMAEADPLAEIAVGLECPICQHASEKTLDLSSFLWAEVEARARRLIFEVHTLAATYGWPESAILALSDARRTAYLQAIQA